MVGPLKERGIEVIESSEPRVADVVLVGWDQLLTYGALRAALQLRLGWRSAARDVNSARFSVDGGRAPGWSRRRGGRDWPDHRMPPVDARKAVTGGAARNVARALGVPATQTAVVGDDLSLEIAMARRAGAAAALVLTGVSTRQKPRGLPGRARSGRRPTGRVLIPGAPHRGRSRGWQ